METTATTNKFRFTKTAIAGAVCPPDKKRVRFYDDLTPGLTLTVTNNGSKVFYLYRFHAGRPLEVRIDAADRISIDDARKAVIDHNAKLVKGINPQQEKRVAREAATLGDLWKTYRAEVKKRARSLENDAGTWDRYLEPWETRRLSDVTIDAVQKLYNRIAGGEMNRKREDAKGVNRTINGGPVAANRTVALLSHMFNASGRRLGGQGNPCQGIQGRKKETACERYLAAEELPAFWLALNALSEDMRDLFKLALFTGQRKATLESMRWAEVNFNFKVWTIPAEKMKGAKAHTVPLVPQAMEILERRKSAAADGAEWVFAASSASGHIQEPKKALKAITTAAGIQPVTLHDFRRTIATWMNAEGASESIIAAILAHKYRNITGIYARATEDAKRVALEKGVAALVKVATAKPEKKKRAG